MTQAANNYGQVLYELKVPKEMVEEAEVLFREVPQLKEALVSPVVKKSEKNRVIDRVFPAELRNFLKVLCGHQDMGEVEDVPCLCMRTGRQSASNVVLCDGAGRRAA